MALKDTFKDDMQCLKECSIAFGIATSALLVGVHGLRDTPALQDGRYECTGRALHKDLSLNFNGEDMVYAREYFRGLGFKGHDAEGRAVKTGPGEHWVCKKPDGTTGPLYEEPV